MELCKVNSFAHVTSVIEELFNFDNYPSISYLPWPTLEQRRHHSRLTMMYKIFNRLVDIDLPARLTRTNANTTRGHSSRILEYSCSYNAYARSFYPRTAHDLKGPYKPRTGRTVHTGRTSQCMNICTGHTGRTGRILYTWPYTRGRQTVQNVNEKPAPSPSAATGNTHRPSNCSNF